MISILQAAKLFLGLRDVQVLRQIAQVIRDLFQLLDDDKTSTDESEELRDDNGTPLHSIQSFVSN